MPQPTVSWISDDGKLHADETAATRHEVLRDLWKSFPDLKQSRSLIEARLPEIVQILAPLMPLFPRNHPEAGETTLADPPVAGDQPVDHGELAGTCDCPALMPGNDGVHSPSCPSYRKPLRGEYVDENRIIRTTTFVDPAYDQAVQDQCCDPECKDAMLVHERGRGCPVLLRA